MRRFARFAALFAITSSCTGAHMVPSPSAPSSAQNGTVVLHTSKLLDGKGGMMGNADIVVADGKIQSVGPAGTVPSGARELTCAERPCSRD